MAFPNAIDQCADLCSQYDTLISDLILSDKPIAINQLLELPAMITVLLFESEGSVDQDVRW